MTTHSAPDKRRGLAWRWFLHWLAWGCVIACIIALALSCIGCGREARFVEVATSIASQVTHGERDNQLSDDEMLAKFDAGERLYITCSHISYLGVLVFKRAGFRAHTVATETLMPKNGYDDGHNLLEVYSDEQKMWVVLDLDNNVFPTVRGQPVAIAEWVSVVQVGDAYELQSLAHDALLDTQWSYYNEFKTMDLRRWYRRVLGHVVK